MSLDSRQSGVGDYTLRARMGAALILNRADRGARAVDEKWRITC
jgi:hypothetical protein